MQNLTTPTETVFLDESGIFVSNTRFIAHNHVFALANIVSVRAVKIGPQRAGPILIVMMGICALFITLWAAIPLILLACLWFALQKPSGCVLVTGAGGEIEAFESPDCDFVLRILNALDQAILARG
jgi:hypothetical protein